MFKINSQDWDGAVWSTLTIFLRHLDPSCWSSFLTFLEHDSIANSCLTKGKCHLQLKLFNYFWKNQEKEFNLELLLDLGHMRSGKRTRGERRRKHNCIVLCSGVCRSGEHSAETLHIIIYKCNEAMTKLQRLVQWSSDEKEALHKYIRVQWSNDQVAVAIHNIIYECNKATMVLLRLYIILPMSAMKQRPCCSGFT